MVLGNLAVSPHLRRRIRLIEDGGQVKPLGFPVIYPRLRYQSVGTSHHLVDSAEAKPGHQFSHLLGDEAHKVNHVVWIARELCPELWILGGDAHRAGVQVADPHHGAAQDYQRRGGEAIFLRAQQGGDHHISTRFELAIRLHHDSAAQVIHNQSLMRFGQAQFPGQTGVLDAALRGGARPAVIAADEHHVGVALGHAGGDGAHPHFGYQLDVDARPRVGVFEVVDQFG